MLIGVDSLTGAVMGIPSFSQGVPGEAALKKLEHLVSAHVDSFNYFIRSGLPTAVGDLNPLEMVLEEVPGRSDRSTFIRMYFDSVSIASPSRSDGVADEALTPRECRERQITYGGLLIGNMVASIETPSGATADFEFSVKLGNVPIMVMSEKCHLRGSAPPKLVSLGEEATEVGGYFVLNGIERVIRLLQLPRRNHAMAIERSSYRNRGPLYSDKGVAMRCVRPDQSSVTITLHYLTNGGATVKFVLRKQEFLVPVVIVARALCDVTDREFSGRVLQGDDKNTFVSSRMELLLRDAKQFSLPRQIDCLAYLGSHFRAFLPISNRTSDEDAGKMLIQKYFFVHVTNFQSKFECLLHMMRKMFNFGKVAVYF